MPLYDYECNKCGNVITMLHKISETPELECECGGEVRRVILSAPATVIPPQHQAAGSKLSYYGVKDVVTGEGIENLKPGWNQGDPGIKVKSLK